MRTRRGFTLIEMTLVSMIMSLLVVGIASLFSNTIKSFTNTTNQYDADMSASIALQIVNRDLQEAKQVQIISPTSIRVYYPKLEANGTYNRTILDAVNYVDFYRGKLDGTPSTTGKCLIRKPAVGELRPICEDVKEVQFMSISPSSVDITLRTERKTDTVVRHCDMVHRAIFLRNY
jgi:prepilin-type N-terminal cleavage/methylation domain-containing protein